MRRLFTFLSLTLLLTCAKEDSQAPNTPPSQIVRQYTLTVSAGDGGSVSTTGGTFASGTQVSITATPNAGYSFSSWSNGSTANPLNVTLNSNTTVTANFEAIVNSYTLSVSAGEGGSVSSEGGEYEEGTEVTITATPNEGYEFTGWSDGSQDESITLILNEDKSIEASFERLPFVSISERYSTINESTGWFNNQNNFSRYIKNSEQLNLNIPVDNCVNYLFGTQDHVSYDFNADGYLDLFAFMYRNDGCSAQYNVGRTPGKYMIIDNYYNGGTEKILFDTQTMSGGGIMELNDIDNDGTMEVVFMTNHRHEVQYDNSLEAKDYIIIEVSPDLSSIYEQELNYTPFDTHDGTSGDIDGDGDIDLVKIRIGQILQPVNMDFPKVLLNNGGTVFSEIELFRDREIVEDLFPGGMASLSYRLFDVDGDNQLDLISAYNIGDVTPRTEKYIPGVYPLAFHDYYTNVVIFWGDSSGTFSIDNMTVLEDSNYLNEKQMVLSFTFTDFDSDGDIDIISSSTFDNPNYYNGFALNLFRNNGDKSFTDTTQQQFDESYDYGSYFYEMYSLYSVDVDNDGDYDLVPGDTHSWDWSRVSIDNLYWENNSGNFSVKKIP